MTSNGHMSRRACSLCHREAVARVDGKYRNGREATDYRCKAHRPERESLGSWAFMGTTATLFRIETVEVVR